MEIDLTDIHDIQLNDVDMKDYPDFVDAYIETARFKSSGELLTDEQLNYINDDQCEFVQEQAHASMFW